MDLQEPFADEITLEKDNGQKITPPVKYERLPNICYFCGRVGHVERDCDLKEEGEEGTITYRFGEWMRVSLWKPIKDEGGKNGRLPNAARRLVFKPKSKQINEITASIEEMTENFIRVSFEGAENEKGEEHKSNQGLGIDTEGVVENDMLTLGDDTSPTNKGSKISGSWYRLKRSTEIKQKHTEDPTGCGRRSSVEVEMIDSVTPKKLKASEAKHGVNILSTEAAEQPRKSPRGSSHGTAVGLGTRVQLEL